MHKQISWETFDQVYFRPNESYKYFYYNNSFNVTEQFLPGKIIGREVSADQWTRTMSRSSKELSSASCVTILHEESKVSHPVNLVKLFISNPVTGLV